MSRPHVFVAMPFGIKPGPNGVPIDFNVIYTDLIQAALDGTKYDVFRADQEQRAGDIRADMFQELLVADLVIADLTVDNPNVWYELGVRHALRARGVVLIQGPRERNAFDIYTDRKLTYALKPDGTLDRDRLSANIDALAAMVSATLTTSTRRKVSPVYALLPHLEQPTWRRLMLSGDNEFSDAHAAWSRRMQIALQKSRPGDVLSLATETPTRALQVEALRAAGDALLKLRHHDFALEQFEAALAIDPDDTFCRQKKAICLSRLDRVEDAQVWVTELTDSRPGDADSWLQAGRVAKETWIGRWRGSDRPRRRGAERSADRGSERGADRSADPAGDPRGDPNGGDAPPAAGSDKAGATPAAGSAASTAATIARCERAAEEDASLKRAFELCHAAFILDSRHIGAGIQALMLLKLREHLSPTAVAAEGQRLECLTGGVRWACHSRLEQRSLTDPPDYTLMIGRAELALLLEPADAVRRHYQAAMATAGRDWFALETSRRTLELLAELGFRATETAAALALVLKEQRLMDPPVSPRKVFLFSGHMMDAPGREIARFTPAMEPWVTERIRAALAEADAGPDDLAMCQGAAGGDLIFLEACVERRMHIQMMIPFDEATFIHASVEPSHAPLQGPSWIKRFYALRKRLRSPPRLMPIELGPLPVLANPFERCNLWLLNSGLAWGVDKLQFITLWNGGGSDGPGGTAHMLHEVKRRTGNVTWIDTRDWRLLGAAAPGAAADSPAASAAPTTPATPAPAAAPRHALKSVPDHAPPAALSTVPTPVKTVAAPSTPAAPA